jgi:hypothetical protein
MYRRCTAAVPQAPITDLATLADDGHLLAASEDRSLSIWVRVLGVWGVQAFQGLARACVIPAALLAASAAARSGYGVFEGSGAPCSRVSAVWGLHDLRYFNVVFSTAEVLDGSVAACPGACVIGERLRVSVLRFPCCGVLSAGPAPCITQPCWLPTRTTAYSGQRGSQP